MIMWSGWGLLVPLFGGAGVLLGVQLAHLPAVEATGLTTTGSIGVGLVVAAVALAVFARLAVGRLIDRPRPAYVTERLAAPVRDERGRRVRTVRTPVLHPETGEHVLVQHLSTFYTAPIGRWPAVMAALGLVVTALELV